MQTEDTKSNLFHSEVQTEFPTSVDLETQTFHEEMIENETQTEGFFFFFL